MSTLTELGAKNGTDKVDIHHTFAGSTYLDVYKEYTDPIRDSATCVLELGVLRGGSLRTWRDYFTQAQVWGLDIDPGCRQNNGERTHVVIGSQADPAAVAKVAPGEQFDMVLDDASHLVEHQIRSFDLLFPRVKSGGLYIIEDLRCTYTSMLPWKNEWPGQHLNTSDADFNTPREALDAFFSRLIKRMDHFEGDVRFVHFWSMMCIIKKL